MIDEARIAELKKEVGEEDFAEILDVFLEEIDEALGALDPSCPTDRLAADLHALKGSAQNIGFAEFAGICLAAEAGPVPPDLKPRLTRSLAASRRALSANPADVS